MSNRFTAQGRQSQLREGVDAAATTEEFSAAQKNEINQFHPITFINGSRRANWLKIQYVQNLQQLSVTVKPTK